jgi:hypothetical protein
MYVSLVAIGASFFKTKKPRDPGGTTGGWVNFYIHAFPWPLVFGLREHSRIQLVTFAPDMA